MCPFRDQTRPPTPTPPSKPHATVCHPLTPPVVGYEPLPTLASTILARSGPSGPNKDYLYRLAEAVRSLWPDVEDEYLFALEVSLSSVMGRRSTAFLYEMACDNGLG